MGKVIEAIAGGFKESTRAAREISKENLQAEKDAAKVRHAEATAPHPGMAEFKEAKGFKGKAKAAAKGMKESCQRAKEEERQRRDDAIHLTATKELLDDERARREKLIKLGKKI